MEYARWIIRLDLNRGRKYIARRGLRGANKWVGNALVRITQISRRVVRLTDVEKGVISDGVWLKRAGSRVS